MHDACFRSKAQRSRLRHSSGSDAVKVSHNGNYRTRHGRWNGRAEADRIRQCNVDGEEVTAVSGEVVVDSETALRVERLWCCRLHNS